MGERLTVRVIQELSQIEEIRSSWESWQSHPNAHLDDYRLRFQYRPEFLRPHIIVVEREGKPDALLVGRLDRATPEFKFGKWRVFKTEARSLSFLYGGMLGQDSPENCQLMVDEILQSLRQGVADFAVLNHVRKGSPILEIAQRCPARRQRDAAPVLELHCGMTVPRKIEEVYSRLKSDYRSEVRRKLRKVRADFHGEVKLVSFRQPTEIASMVETVESIARKTYQRGIGVGFIDTPEMRARLELAARRGLLRAYVLHFASEASAFCVGGLYRGVFYGEYVGYDPQFNDYSPGTLLLMLMLEEFCQDESVREYDFGYGSEWYKQRFGDRQWQEALVTIYAPTLRALRLKALRTILSSADRGARAILERAHLIGKARRAWRQKALPRESTPR